MYKRLVGMQRKVSSLHKDLCPCLRVTCPRVTEKEELLHPKPLVLLDATSPSVHTGASHHVVQIHWGVPEIIKSAIWSGDSESEDRGDNLGNERGGRCRNSKAPSRRRMALATIGSGCVSQNPIAPLLRGEMRMFSLCPGSLQSGGASSTPNWNLRHCERPSVILIRNLQGIFEILAGANFDLLQFPCQVTGSTNEHLQQNTEWKARTDSKHITGYTVSEGMHDLTVQPLLVVQG